MQKIHTYIIHARLEKIYERVKRNKMFSNCVNITNNLYQFLCSNYCSHNIIRKNTRINFAFVSREVWLYFKNEIDKTKWNLRNETFEEKHVSPIKSSDYIVWPLWQKVFFCRPLKFQKLFLNFGENDNHRTYYRCIFFKTDKKRNISFCILYNEWWSIFYRTFYQTYQYDNFKLT